MADDRSHATKSIHPDIASADALIDWLTLYKDEANLSSEKKFHLSRLEWEIIAEAWDEAQTSHANKGSGKLLPEDDFRFLDE
ncbi:MAG: hypothetical protein KME16_05500 [Scytolyngbya sp. HA4215-MV1]|jgi:hypothetical protein|nr:hypothetical protein [Scytolyngbya sp. HA4215-MV1]